MDLAVVLVVFGGLEALRMLTSNNLALLRHVLSEV